ncbi:hypothetical protein [Anabaena sp. CCY 9910]|uniref:hypothetical protein n=1 Tax=Anabaena sp. CCY 9910 TaxID=3103870 RepID=UPI0039E19393
MNDTPFHPKGEPLALTQLIELSTIRKSDVAEMVKRSHRTTKPFINADIRPQ